MLRGRWCRESCAIFGSEDLELSAYGSVDELVFLMKVREFAESTHPSRESRRIGDGCLRCDFFIDGLSDELAERDAPKCGTRLGPAKNGVRNF